MRGGKDEGKVTIPMFPRLHVNDTDKGGPRPPPRNKMALYEQLSIPSQRLGSGSTSMFPVPPSNASTLCSSMSSSNGGGHERSVYTPFCNSPAAPLLSEKLHSYSSSGIKLNAVMTNQEWKSIAPGNYQSFNARGPLSSTATSCSSKPSNFSNSRNFSTKNVGEENGSRVPTSARFGLSQQHRNSHHSKDRKYKLEKESVAGDLKSRPYAKNQNEDSAKVSQRGQDPGGRSTSIALTRNRNLVDTSSSPLPKVKHSESLKTASSSLNQVYTSSLVDILNGLHGDKARSHLECEALRDEMAPRDSFLTENARDMDKAIAFGVRTKTGLKPSLRDNNSSPDVIVDSRGCQEDKNDRSIQVRKVDRHDDVSNSSIEDSVSALAISPDDVIGVMGEKQFWKARRAIINQQRVFAIQVFELHRLMKVQRLIARSPHLLIENNLFIDKPPLNISPVKRLQSEYDREPSPRVVRAKHHSQRPDLSTEFGDENAAANLTHPSANNDACTGLVNSTYGSDSENASPAPAVRNIMPSSWCFPPPGNQWLVSVMCPSEGLFYKPYTGPCPPTAGFVAPFYGSCGPMSLPPAGGDFLKTAYGVPESHQQGFGILQGTPALAQTYFPPYGMPVMNSCISDSAVEQMSPFPEAQSKDNHSSVVDVNFMIPHQNSRNMSSQISRVISRCLGKVQASKESEVQGSTASSSPDMPEGGALPLFPMEPILQASEQNPQSSEQQTRVIKVVPHNRRLATESAARIFQSIQQERKQYD